MTIDATSPRSRRALLTAAVGGVAAAAAASVARVAPVEALDPNDVRLGQSNTAHTRTVITALSSGDAFQGHGQAGGDGVHGTATTGTGIVARSNSGIGLHVSKGRIKVSQVSGVATIKKGKKSVTVKPGVDINGKTFVLLTPMANLGSRSLWFTRSGTKDSITIRMSSTRGGPTKIAWLALERG
jgi:hypothetical protein